LKKLVSSFKLFVLSLDGLDTVDNGQQACLQRFRLPADNQYRYEKE
jgi:hypothetical protein